MKVKAIHQNYDFFRIVILTTGLDVSRLQSVHSDVLLWVTKYSSINTLKVEFSGPSPLWGRVWMTDQFASSVSYMLLILYLLCASSFSSYIISTSFHINHLTKSNIGILHHTHAKFLYGFRRIWIKTFGIFFFYLKLVLWFKCYLYETLTLCVGET